MKIIALIDGERTRLEGIEWWEEGSQTTIVTPYDSDAYEVDRVVAAWETEE